jgi:hypothetical protein
LQSKLIATGFFSGMKTDAVAVGDFAKYRTSARMSIEQAIATVAESREPGSRRWH